MAINWKTLGQIGLAGIMLASFGVQLVATQKRQDATAQQVRNSPTAGPTGGVGPTGPQGAVGAKGDTGSQGQQGATGATGPAGATGAAGTNGTNGTNGTSPPNCTTPMGTALNPVIGTGTPCSYRPDSTVRLQDQHINTTTTTGGTWSVTWARTMTSSTPIVHSDQLDNSTNAGNCKIMTRSATGATGVCFTGSILTILGLQVTLLSVVASGVPVMVSGSEPTQ